MHRFTFIVAVVAIFSTAAPAVASAGDVPENRIDQIFTRLDKDRDGRISREEAEGHPRFKERFDKVDSDRDGFITKQELRAAFQRLKRGR